MVFQNRGRPQGNINKKGKSWFFKIAVAQLEIRARVSKSSRLELKNKLAGYGILPGFPVRVCPVIARFLAGGILFDEIQLTHSTLRVWIACYFIQRLRLAADLSSDLIICTARGTSIATKRTHKAPPCRRPSKCWKYWGGFLIKVGGFRVIWGGICLQPATKLTFVKFWSWVWQKDKKGSNTISVITQRKKQQLALSSSPLLDIFAFYLVTY